MKDLESMALKVEGGKLFVLDQQMLPHKEDWIESKTPEEMSKIILDLKTRGAPLIGVSAALSLALYAEEEPVPEKIMAKAEHLRNSRPTAVNLMNAIDRILEVGQKSQWTPTEITKEAENIFGRIDVLINNAGVTADNLFLRMKDEDWDTVLNINLSAGMRLTRHVIKGML